MGGTLCHEAKSQPSAAFSCLALTLTLDSAAQHCTLYNPCTVYSTFVQCDLHTTQHCIHYTTVPLCLHHVVCCTLCLTVHRSCPLKCSENTQKCSTDLGSCTIACFNHVLSFSGQIRIDGNSKFSFLQHHEWRSVCIAGETKRTKRKGILIL